MMSEKDIVSKEQVTSQMMQNWGVKKTSDQQLAGECHCTVTCSRSSAPEICYSTWVFL